MHIFIIEGADAQARSTALSHVPMGACRQVMLKMVLSYRMFRE